MAQDDSATVVQGSTIIIPVLANDSDEDGDSLTVQNVRRAKGVVHILDNGSLSYRPTPRFTGEDKFRYTIDDGNRGRANAFVIVFVTEAQANQDSVAPDLAITTDEDTTVTFNVIPTVSDDDDDKGMWKGKSYGKKKGTWYFKKKGTWYGKGKGVWYGKGKGKRYGEDNDGNITLTGLTQPSDGTATDNGDGTITYTPNPDFNGSDEFTYTLSFTGDGDNKGRGRGRGRGNDSDDEDDEVRSATGTIYITVNAVNDAPVITSPATATATEDERFTYTATASDVDNPSVDIAISALSDWLTADGSTVSGTPTEGVTSGSFTITASDGELTALLDVTVTIGQVNDAPVITSPATAEATEDELFTYTATATDADNPSIDITISNLSDWLTADGSTVSGIPTEGVTSGSFTITADDGELTAVLDVTVTIGEVNDAPVAADIPDQTISEGGAFTAISLDDYVTDPDNADSEITWSYSGAADLTVTINNNHVAAIGIPDADWNGSETITFTATDPGGLSDSDPATFNVTAENDAPVAVADTFSVPEDSPVRTLDVLANDIDVDGDDLIITNYRQANGIVHISDNEKYLSYEPTPNFSGEDVFYYTIRDAAGAEAEAQVTVIVGGVNDAPVADAQSVTTKEDTQLDITLTGSDPDEDELTYSVTSGPSHGALSGTAPDLTYTPASHYSGSDGFTFRVTDPGGLYDEADVTITVAEVNLAPVADAQSVTTKEDTQLDITLTGSDPDEDALTYSVTSGPSHGALSGTAPDLTYTPASHYSGSDGFTFRVTDPGGLYDEADVTIAVAEVNLAPVADAQSVTTKEDTPLDITLTGSDPDGDELTFTVTSEPANGSLTGTAPNLTYTPGSHYSGSDGFTFRATDPGGLYDEADVTIEVTEVNLAPVADAQSVSTKEDTPLDIILTGSDPDEDALTYSITSDPSHGALSGTAPDLTYTPASHYSGSDGFTFRVTDPGGLYNEADVTIEVTEVNLAPVADAQSVTTKEDTPLDIILTGSDPDEDALTYSVTSGPSHGALSGTAPDLTYTPASHYSGSDVFTFRVTDPGGLYNEADVTIEVTEVNLAPVADAQSVTTKEDTPLEIILTGSDPDEDALTYSITSDPSHGALSGTAPDLTYTPASHYSGSDVFTFRVTDPGGLYDEADVTIEVTEVNLAPVADAQSVSTKEDTPLEIILTGSDPDGDALTYSITRGPSDGARIAPGPSHGALSGDAPNLTYTPASHYSGSDGFTFRVTDPGGLYDEADVTIEVTEVNLTPVADAQSVSTKEDTPLDIILTGSDPDEDALTYSVTSDPSQGALSGDAPNLTYTPASHYSGSDGFTFRVTDPGGLYDEATVTVLVNLAGDLAADEPVDPDAGGTVTTDIGVSVEIPGGSLSEAVNIQIGTYNEVPPGAPDLAGILYFFGPSGTTFYPQPATITVPYNPLTLPDEFDENNLVLLIYNESNETWEEALNSVVDTDAQTVSGQTYHLSGFAAGLLLSRAPYSLGLPGVSINEDAQATTIIQDLTDYFADPNFGDQIDFDATNLDTGLHLVLVANDSLIVEPRPNFNGDVRIVITATDLTGLSVSDTLFLTVTPDNDSPFFLTAVADAYTISEDQLLRIHLSADDVEGDDVTFGATSDTSAVTTLVQDTTLLVAPVQNWYGTAHIVVSASDGQNTTYLDPFTLTIEAVNDPPSAFELLAPDIDALLQVETSQLGDSLTFTWKEVIDPDDPVNYTFTLSDAGAIYFEYDTTTTATEVRVPYADIVSAITNQGLKTAAFEWTVVAIAGQDIIEASNGPNSLTVDINTLAVMDESHLPQFFALHQNYPNPFNPVTTLRYELPAYCQVLLVIYDMRGREVVRLVDGYISAGYNRVIWNSGDAFGRPVPSGIYFARLITPEYTRVIKMSLIR